MKKFWRKPMSLAVSLSLVLSAATAAPAIPAYAATDDLADHVVINEVYGGGGNSGATYTNDFIELYNPTLADVSLDGWSVQYASSAGTTWSATALSGTIRSGHYYLVQETQGSGGTVALPSPDAAGTIAMSSSKGKVALVHGTDAVSGKGDSAVVDFVGWGGANEYEGSAAAPVTANATGISRKSVGADTDDNAADFSVGTPTPQNSSETGPVGGGEKDSSVTFDPLPDAQGYVDSGTPVYLSCGTPGAEIHYTLNSGSDTMYRDSIVINEDTTIKAWAVIDGTPGPFYTQAYKVKSAAPADGTTSISDARQITDPYQSVTVKGVVTRVVGGSIYMQDDTAGICVYKYGTAFAAADYPRGTTLKVTGTVYNYKTLIEFEPSSADDITIDSSVPVQEKTPKTVSLAEAAGSGCQGQLVKIVGAKMESGSGSKYTISQNGTTETLYAYSGTAFSGVAVGDTVDVVCIASAYSNAPELILDSADDIAESGGGTPGAKVASVVATPGNSATAKVGDKVRLSCATEGAAIYYSTDPDAADSAYLQYDDSKEITLDKLPVTISAFAAKDGLQQSEKAYFVYQEQFTGTYNIYFGQLHSHTTLSDGVGSVEEAFRHASQVKNLDFLAVTDHSNYFETAAEASAHLNTILDGSHSASWVEGHDAAAEITKGYAVTKYSAGGDTTEKINTTNTDNPDDPNSTFLGIYGYEMTWSDGSGHINTYNTPGFEDRQNPTYCNKSQSASNPAGLDAYYKTLTTAPDSISQFNHPGTTFGDFYDFADYSPTYDQMLDMVEVGNGEGPIRGVGYFPSYEDYTRALDKGWHVAPTNNQDNHKGNWGDSNTARSVILAQSLSEDSLYDAMRNHRMYATEDNDLSIRYTVDGAVMGSEITVGKGENLSVHTDLSDPTDKSIGKVEVIVNGGRVAASKELSSDSGSVDFSVPNNYSYYYLRVTEADQDIAVTAPVWTADVDKAGIASVTSDTDLPVKGEPLNVTASLYNNEIFGMTVESLTFKAGDQVIKSVDGASLDGGADLPSLGTNSCTFAYTPEKAGSTTINAAVTVKTEDGTEKTYTNALQIEVADPSAVTRVVIDGTHYNDYVTGYYSQNMNNVTKIAADNGTQVRVLTDEITPDVLKNTQLLVISAPAKTPGTSKEGDAYTPQAFSDGFISMVRDYVKNGGTAVVCGLSDYSDNDGGDPYTSSKQINDLLQGIGAKSTISNDEVTDQDQNGGQPYRLYFKNYNMKSPYLDGVDPGQEYSFYSGCSVNPGEGAQWLVKGYDTTYSINSRQGTGEYESGVPFSSASDAYDEAKAVKKKGDVCALAEEDVGSGHVLIAGTVFLSDFEVKAVKDNNWDLDYSNKTIFQNVMNSVKVDIPTASIADVRRNGQSGDVFEVEGTVTAGSEQPNAFTDTVYIQDSTGGINVYPVPNGSGIKVGQKLLVVGHVDEYQGDKELKIGNGVEHYEVTDQAENPLSPVSLSAAAASDYGKYGGSLVKVAGTVSGIVSLGGVIQSFTLSSGSGQIRILINGYISPSVDLSGVVKEGASVSAAGLVYMDPDGVCLRVRDRNEIVSAAAQTGGNNVRGSDSSSTPASVPGSASTVTTSGVGGRTVASVTGRPDAPAEVAAGRANLTITVPSAVVSELAGATPQNPSEVRVTLSPTDILPQFNNGDVQTVGLTVRIPSGIAENTTGSVRMTLTMPAELLNQAKATQKNLVMTVADTSGRELYSWSFSGARLNRSPVDPGKDLDLAVAIGTAAGNTPESDILAANGAAGEGVVLNFGENGLLPAPADVRVYVGNRQGIQPNSTAYLYYYNRSANLLEQMPGSRCSVDSDGYADIRIIHCSEYILMPGAAEHPYPVRSDTTYPVGLKTGETYTFSVSALDGAAPALNVGNGKAFAALVKRKDDRYYVTVKATGNPGQVTALYSTVGGQKPVVLCYLFVEE